MLYFVTAAGNCFSADEMMTVFRGNLQLRSLQAGADFPRRGFNANLVP